jgi:Rad3-related DNA helicase
MLKVIISHTFSWDCPFRQKLFSYALYDSYYINKKCLKVIVVVNTQNPLKQITQNSLTTHKLNLTVLEQHEKLKQRQSYG